MIATTILPLRGFKRGGIVDKALKLYYAKSDGIEAIRDAYRYRMDAVMYESYRSGGFPYFSGGKKASTDYEELSKKLDRLLIEENS